MTDKAIQTDEELDTLFPEPIAVPIGGGKMLDVPAMDLATCIRFGKKARPIIEPIIMVGAAGGNLTLHSILLAFWPALIQAPDELLPEALAIALGKTPEFVGKLPPGALWPVINAIVSVNSDFFYQSVGSLVSGAQEKTNGNPAADGAGLTH
jgi:hypothetical protein